MDQNKLWKEKNDKNGAEKQFRQEYKFSTSKERKQFYKSIYSFSPKVEDTIRPKNNSINVNKKLTEKEIKGRLREGIKRLERCRYIWNRIEGIKLLESIINQDTIDEETYKKLNEVLTKYSEDISEVISSKSKNLRDKLTKIKQNQKQENKD